MCVSDYAVDNFNESQRTCVPEELDDILAVAPFYAVFSPNLLEMQSILSIPPTSPPREADVMYAAETFRRLVRRTGKRAPAIIVRAGGMGSYTLSGKWSGWVPAYWGPKDQHLVVDVTGGGNAFLGGLCAGLLLSDGDFRTGEHILKSWMRRS